MTLRVGFGTNNSKAGDWDEHHDITNLVDHTLRIEHDMNDTKMADEQTSKDTQNSRGPIKNKKKGWFNKKPYNQENNQQRTGGNQRCNTNNNMACYQCR